MLVVTLITLSCNFSHNNVHLILARASNLSQSLYSKISILLFNPPIILKAHKV